MKVLLLGLDGDGKTTILYKLMTLLLKFKIIDVTIKCKNN